MMSDAMRLALVTGANRGIGFEVCRQLAHAGYHMILSGRDEARAKVAAEKLRAEGFHMCCRVIDVTDPESIQATYERIAKNHGYLDVLVNNAGVMLDDRSSPSVFDADLDTIRESFEINTLGPLRMIQTFLPLLEKAPAGRIVNVSSGMGQLSEMNGGYAGYRFSKTSLNALTRMVADELQDTAIKVNSVCPGWVKTDMGGAGATREVEQGAETVVWLATLPEDGPTGGFFRDKQAMEW